MKKGIKLLISGIICSVMLSGCQPLDLVGGSKSESVEEVSEQTAEAEKQTRASSQEDYILPSDSEVINEIELSKLNETELRYAYAEVFARHGKAFEDDNWTKYFNSKDWYVPNPSYKDSDLSELEVENANYIKSYINAHYETTTQPTTAQQKVVVVQQSQPIHSYDDGFIIPDSSIRRLTVSELSGYSSDTLALIRNEIYARNGYVFQKQKYKDYFGSKSWYSPNYSFNESWLNATEKYNVQLIKSME